ncbi:MAG: hypothetical protein CO187_03080 [Zetaproteobacteria bacterium CG_4_9_14_3_um_filter_53_7]|nr:MAG: hypothetical protein CO187_03080 [Zetaproteobacteria bacterium CG_4_9_14_3_um_filter_53_7]
MGNLVLWRSIYEADGRFHVDGLRVGLGNEKSYPGESIKRFELSDLPLLSHDSVLAADIKRFDFFSDGYTALLPGDKPVIGDARYSMLPTSTKPIWGIELNLADQQKHTPFNQFHDTSDLTRQTFIDMLLGEDIRIVKEEAKPEPQARADSPESRI